MFTRFHMWLLALVAAVGIATIPALLRAEDSDTVSNIPISSDKISSQAQENVVISPTDKPLERKEKLARHWVLYNDGTAVWALYAPRLIDCGGIVVGTPQTCPPQVIQKRAVQTMSFFTAFKANFQVKLVNPERLARFTTGAPITSMDGLTPGMFIKRPYLAYRLVKAANSAAVYLDDGAKLRPIVHEKVFKNLGLDFKDVETVAATEISNKPIEAAVMADTVLDESVEVKTTAARKTVEEVKSRLGTDMLKKVRDAVVKAGQQYFLMTKNGKRPIPPAQENQLSQKLHLDLSKSVEVTAEEAAAIPTVAEVTTATTQAEVNTSAQ